jgi:hypothetical protein
MKKTTPNETDRDLLRVATFILFDAAVFHEALASNSAYVTSLRKATPPLQSFLDAEWAKILRIDYAPVFNLARDVLQAFPTSPDTELVLRRLIDTAISAVSSGVLLRHDFMGRVYHKLLLRTTAHFYATYYTSIPAAWLLSNLVIKSPHPSWRMDTLDAITAFRAIDPACGSGTLLSAVYMALKDRYILARPPSLDLDALHKALVEHVLHGWDILDYATHLTLTTLTLHSNRVAIQECNVLTLDAGVGKDDRVYLGSLDYLHKQQQLVGRGFTAPVRQQSLEGARERDIAAVEYDAVIMNPPFSRSAKPNRKFGYSTANVRQRMADALRNLTRDIGASGIGQAGLGAHFMLLGLRLAKPDGRIGVVIPRATLSGVSWGKVRNDYMQRCELEYVVSNYDPGKLEDGIEPWCWSENTDLGEVLIVARKSEKGSRDGYTTYVNLWNKPRNEIEALLVSHQVIRAQDKFAATLLENEWFPITLQERTVGTIYRVPRSMLARNWLSPCVFANPELNRLVLQTFAKTLPCVRLGDITTHLGVDIKQVKDHFAQSDRKTTYPLVWGHQSVMNTIRLAPEHVGYGRPKGGAKAGQLHEHGASSLLIAERPHLSTEALLAMKAPEEVLTTAFWEVRPRREAWSTAILLWLNSTYGVLQYLACATSSMGDIFKMKKDQLEAAPVVDPEKIDLRECASILNSLGRQAFLPFAAEFSRAATGAGPRRALDDFFRKVLQLPNISKKHYELLSQDPIITKRRM